MQQGVAENNQRECWRCGRSLGQHPNDSRGFLNIGSRCGETQEIALPAIFADGRWWTSRDELETGHKHPMQVQMARRSSIR